MSLPKKIHLREVGLREGLQSLSFTIPTQAKLELLDLLSQTGVSSIEIGSFVRADRVPSMADIDQLATQFTRYPCVEYTALYLNVKGFELAEATKKLDNSSWVALATSDTFLQRNANTNLATILADFPLWAKAFKAANKTAHGLMISTAFGCAYEGKISVQRLTDVISQTLTAAENSGLSFKEVCLADTVGLASPSSIKAALNVLQPQFSKINFSLHLHDTRGLGLANAYAGLELGIDTFEASVGGIGGCPFSPGASGNIASEDFIYLCHELGVETGVDLEKYRQAVRAFESVLGISLPGKWAKTKG